MNRADIAIIGTGPAGISAAITSVLRGKSVLLFGSADISQKVSRAERIMNYTGLPDISGKELAAALQKHLDSMDIKVTRDRITNVYDMGQRFALQGASSQMYEAAALIMAVGAAVSKPYPGEKELLGMGVSYCATCDAPLHKGKNTAVIADSPEEEGEVKYLASVCENVLYFPLYKDKPDFSENNIKVLADIPREIVSKSLSERTLVTDRGEYDVSCVFILRRAIAADTLLPQLSAVDGHITVDRLMRTNVRGCFACGDITGRPYQYIKAAGEGNIAALSAVEFLMKEG